MANDNKSYISYLNKLVNELMILIIVVLVEKPIDADYSALNEEIKKNLKVPKFKVDNRVKITKHKNIFSKGYTKTGQEIYLLLILC